MNIIEAKNEIKRSVEIYLDKNEFGEYTIPVSKQRPIFMVGAPGIGKAAIMRQIASELDIALVSCSMSHYTRHSALGRPVIKTALQGVLLSPLLRMEPAIGIVSLFWGYQGPSVTLGP